MSVRVGLVGAGPWAGMFHAPMLSADAGTTLAAVWSRRPEAARELAAAHGATAATSFEDLLDRCEAVAFSVPPDIQAQLAPQAALAGKHLILEKPLAFTVPDAERIVAAVDEAGVQTLLMLRNRFTVVGQEFVAAAQAGPLRGGLGSFITGAALPGSPFATPWRIQRGAVLDVGPHVLDLIDAAMGPIVRISATGDPLRWVGMTTEHEGGAVGSVAVSITTPGVRNEAHVRVFGDSGAVVFDGGEADRDTWVSEAITRAFAAAVETGQAPPADVHRGLHLQRLIALVESALG
ncbi:MAG: Gfo/Idh/MocA family oxidoreductase [Marmoricola sp.]